MRDRRNVERMMLSLQKALRMKPNKAEVKLISFFKEKKLDYKYVGNLGFIIDGKNPDFVNVEKKEIIELFGRFWHSNDNDWYNTKNDEEERKVFFEQRGWRVLVVWDNELNDSESLFKRIVEWKKE
jgi:very-short-patch-repair endonuclease